jgi:cytochrome c-type biogenesis protein CcmH/NrfG
MPIALMRLVDALRYADVEAAARRILESRPTHPLALKALGFALIGQARYDEACRLSAFPVERNPVTRNRTTTSGLCCPR